MGCTMKKESLFIFAIFFALIVLTNTHLHYSLGDLIFESLGIAPWTRGNQNGFHLPVILGLIILISGIIGSVKYYSPRYPKIRSRIFICCIAFVLLYPLATEKAMFLFRHNAEGIKSIDLLKKDSRCSMQTTGDEIMANCSITIFNYGSADQLTVRPLLLDSSASIQFEKMTVSITTHAKVGFGAVFYGTQRNETGYQEAVNRFKFELEVNGTSKIFE